MPQNTVVSIDNVKEVLIETLGLEERADALHADTPLLGSLPELDSMAVLELVLDLERQFDIAIEGEDVTAEVFETLATLTVFVNSKLA